MNIVQVEDFFHPDAGYQVNILSKYMVKQGHAVYVIAAEMDKIPENLTAFFGRSEIEQKDKDFTKQTGVNICRVPLKSYISGRVVFTKEIFKLVDNLKPDILYVHGNDTLTGMRYLIKQEKLNYPIVMDSHMLEMASVNKFSKLFRFCYRMFFSPIIIKHEIPIIRTQDDPYVEKCLGIPLEQCPFIPLGSDTLLFHPDETIKRQFREEHNIGEDNFIVLYTGKLDEVKGGKLLATAFRKKFPTKKKVVLLVVGNASGAYREEVEREFADSENRIIRFPTKKYIDLARFYQAADLSVFPKQCSLSFYDAQACGLPVVSEDNNINIDRLKYNNGFNFIAGDVDSFRRKIVQCVNMDKKDFLQMSKNAKEFITTNYNYEDISKQYVSILLDEYKKFNRRSK